MQQLKSRLVSFSYKSMEIQNLEVVSHVQTKDTRNGLAMLYTNLVNYNYIKGHIYYNDIIPAILSNLYYLKNNARFHLPSYVLPFMCPFLARPLLPSTFTHTSPLRLLLSCLSPHPPIRTLPSSNTHRRRATSHTPRAAGSSERASSFFATPLAQVLSWTSIP